MIKIRFFILSHSVDSSLFVGDGPTFKTMKISREFYFYCLININNFNANLTCDDLSIDLLKEIYLNQSITWE